MPEYPTENLTNQKICESYPKLLQIYNSDIVLNGTGSQVELLQITSSYSINSLSASYAPSNYDNSITQSFVSQSIWNFTHSLEEKEILLQTFDENDELILPASTKLLDQNHARFTFPVHVTGYAVAMRGGMRVVDYNLTTAATYPITSSWSNNTVTASYVNTNNVSYSVKKITGSYSVNQQSDYTLICDTTSGSFNLKLPTPSGNTNIYNIKKIDSTGNYIHVTTSNGSNIDFDVTQSISHRGTNMTVQSDGQEQYWIL